jgi:hypothetical protein
VPGVEPTGGVVGRDLADEREHLRPGERLARGRPANAAGDEGGDVALVELHGFTTSADEGGQQTIELRHGAEGSGGSRGRMRPRLSDARARTLVTVASACDRRAVRPRRAVPRARPTPQPAQWAMAARSTCTVTCPMPSSFIAAVAASTTRC